MRAVHGGGETDAPGLVRRDPPDQHFVREAGEAFTREGHVADTVAHFGDGGIEVESATITGGARLFGKGQPHITERLICLLPNRDAHELLHGDLFRLPLPRSRCKPLLASFPPLIVLFQSAGFEFELAALVEQLTQPRQILHCPLVLIFVRLAGPERALVELQLLVADAAKHHRPQPPVADGQRLDPPSRRLIIPQLRGVFRECAVGDGESQHGEHRPGQSGEESWSHTKCQG